MQFVNNDMDDMMRRAAENYPLDTSGADWNKVLMALQDENKAEPEPPKEDRKGRLLWLLLLLPFGLICNQYLGERNSKTNLNVQASRNNNAAGNSRTPDKNQINKPGQYNPNAVENKKALNDGDEERLNETSIPGVPRSKVSDDAERVNTFDLQSADKPRSQSSKTNSDVNNGNQKMGVSDNRSAKGNVKENRIPVLGTANSDLSGSIVPGSHEASRVTLDRTKAELLRHGVYGHRQVAVSDKITNSLPGIFAALAEKNKKKEDQSPDNKKFYAGIMGGVDVSTIKFQKVENIGFDYGILLGYQFSDKWSVEAGAFMDKKSYYSDGKYFNTSRIYLPPNSKITEVSGNCFMWEIPLSVRYLFSSTPKKSWFTTAGITSYIMKKEDYEYLYYYGGSGTSATHYKSYKNSSRNLFSAVQLTGGYTHKVGKIGDLRIEPYLKIPIAEMGFGQLPLMSAGIHVGITRKLF